MSTTASEVLVRLGANSKALIKGLADADKRVDAMTRSAEKSFTVSGEKAGEGFVEQLEKAFDGTGQAVVDELTGDIRVSSTRLIDGAGDIGEAAGRELAEGYQRNADGRIRDASGRLIASTRSDAPRFRAPGEESGRQFGSGFLSMLNRATKPVDAVGARLGSGFKRAFTGQISGLLTGLGAYLAADRVVEILRGSVSEASDLTEAGTKISAIFGRAGDDIQRFAKTTATTIGQSRNQALDAAATFGVFGKAAGLTGRDLSGFSTELVGLSSDMASFYNTDPSQAIEAIGAALRGESEPIRAYGVLLNDATLKAEAMAAGLLKPVKDSAKIKSAYVSVLTSQQSLTEAQEKYGAGSLEVLKAEAALGYAQSNLKKATEGTIPALTSQQKVLAARSAIMKQTTDAQGDFGRTSNNLANQQRILAAQWADTKIKLGKGLLPAVLKLTKWANSDGIPTVRRMIRDWKQHDGVMGDVRGAFEAVGSVLREQVIPVLAGVGGWLVKNRGWIIPLVAVLGTMIATIKTVALVVRAWTAAQVILNTALTANPIGLIIVAVAGLVAAIVIAYRKVGWFRAGINALWAGIKWAWGWIKDHWPLIVGLLVGPLGLAVVMMIRHWDRVKAAVGSVKDWIVDKWNAIIGFLTSIPGRITGALSTAWDGLKASVAAVVDWIKDKIDEVLGPLDEAIGKVKKLFGMAPGGIPLGDVGVPGLATGGYVPPTPGGRIVRLAEGGEGEWVIPHSKAAQFAAEAGRGQSTAPVDLAAAAEHLARVLLDRMEKAANLAVDQNMAHTGAIAGMS